MVSNFASIPVARSGRTCSDPNTLLGLSPSQLESLRGKTTISAGWIDLMKITIAPVTVNGVTAVPATVLDEGGAEFGRVTLALPFDPNTPPTTPSTLPSVGSCVESSSVVSVAGSPTPPTPPSPIPIASATLLNPGAALNIAGPDGTKSIPCALGGCAGRLGGAPPTLTEFIPQTGGNFTFDNGAGAPDVGAFKLQVPMNAAVWSNMQSLGTIDRSHGATVTWTGGDANSYVFILGASSQATSLTSALEGSFTCVAPSSAHQFTIPPEVLLSLPAQTTFAGAPNGSLIVMSYLTPMTVNIPGLDLAFFWGFIANSNLVAYQ